MVNVLMLSNRGIGMETKNLMMRTHVQTERLCNPVCTHTHTLLWYAWEVTECKNLL